MSCSHKGVLFEYLNYLNVSPLPNHNMFKDLSPNSQCVNNIIGESITRSKETLRGKQRPGKDSYKPEPFFGSNYVQESRPCGEVPGDCSEFLLSQGLADLSPSSPLLSYDFPTILLSSPVLLSSTDKEAPL